MYISTSDTNHVSFTVHQRFNNFDETGVTGADGVALPWEVSERSPQPHCEQLTDIFSLLHHSDGGELGGSCVI